MKTIMIDGVEYALVPKGTLIEPDNDIVIGEIRGLYSDIIKLEQQRDADIDGWYGTHIVGYESGEEADNEDWMSDVVEG